MDKIINTREFLKSFDGETLKTPDNKDNLTLGRALSLILSSSSSAADPLKAFLLAEKFYQQAEVSLDDSDFEFVKAKIKEDKMFYPLVTGQLLSMLNSQNASAAEKTPQKKGN